MSSPEAVGPGDLYVHVADDGGIFVVGEDRRLSAWVTLDDLKARLDSVVANSGTVYLSTERGSWIGAPAAQAVADCGAKWVQVDALPEVQRQGGVTALISAAGVGAIGLLDDLIARHADLEQREDLGRTALMVAASKGQVESMRHLLDAGARLDPVDNHRCSALILAANFGWTEAIRFLLDNGADPAARDYKGRDARAAAELAGHPDAAALLPASASSPPFSTRGFRHAWRTWTAPLRSRTVLVNEPDELVVRMVDGALLRIPGVLIAVVCVIIGAATGSLRGLWEGAAVGAVFLALLFAYGAILDSRALRVAGSLLQTRSLWRWSRPVDLRRVAAAHVVPRLRTGPALQLLQADRGPKRAVGIERWGGVQPPPTGPDGEKLRPYLVPLGPAAHLVMQRIAPVLEDNGAVVDEQTRAWIAARS
ncbi:MAG: ankyrin repeat domain-containing protein [Acidimicrobiaceae bacterium]|nr:ankyrin repeat domain-containing protein [Acidimicrobiaceae bacterium]